jgi:hypothetical protein
VEFTGQRINFGVEAGANTRVHLVFKRARAVVASDMPATSAKQQFFHSAPLDEPATVVAFRREKGQLYLATKQIRISRNIEAGFDFKPVTPAEMRSTLAMLEQ